MMMMMLYIDIIWWCASLASGMSTYPTLYFSVISTMFLYQVFHRANSPVMMIWCVFRNQYYLLPMIFSKGRDRLLHCPVSENFAVHVIMIVTCVTLSYLEHLNSEVLVALLLVTIIFYPLHIINWSTCFIIFYNWSVLGEGVKYE